MGYESKAFVIQRHECGESLVLGFEIARVDVSCAGDFKNIFTTPIDFEVRSMATNEVGDEILITEDEYGKPLTYAPIREVIKWLEEEMKKDSYRRYRLLYNLLTELTTDVWSDIRDELVVVHYGH